MISDHLGGEEKRREEEINYETSGGEDVNQRRQWRPWPRKKVEA